MGGQVSGAVMWGAEREVVCEIGNDVHKGKRLHWKQALWWYDHIYSLKLKVHIYCMLKCFLKIAHSGVN